MSIEKVERKGGVVWRVRWRDENGKPHSRVAGRKRDAEALDADIKRRKRMGQLAQMDSGMQTVAECAEEWLELHVVPNLAPRTRRLYVSIFDLHLLPRIGGVALRDMTPGRVERLRADLQASGVGPAATRKALAILQGIFACARRWDYVQTNPVVGVPKPSGQRMRVIVPPSPGLVERMRGYLLDLSKMRDATLISLLAYGGLRPQEALALLWRHVQDRTLLIEQAQSDEGIKETKTGHTRSVRLLGPLAADLNEWRLASGRPDADALVFPTREGDLWREHDYRNWRRRAYRPAARHAGVAGTPYSLRHAFASLLIYEGKRYTEVARQMGNSPETCARVYSHIFEEYDPAAPIPAEAAIRAAREGLVSEMCPSTEVSAVS
jgi:integrase